MKFFKGEAVVHCEPEGAKLLEAFPEYKSMFRKAGWFQFCAKLQDYNYEVARAFAKCLDGYEAQLGDMVIQVSEESIATSTGLPSS